MVYPIFRVGHEMFEDKSEGRSTASCPPLMQISVGPVVMLIVGFKMCEAVCKFNLKAGVDGILYGNSLFAHRPYL